MMTESRDRIGALVMRIQNDFLDRPELALTLPEVADRVATDRTTCKAVLDTLVDAGVLFESRGTYRKLFRRMAA